MSNRMDFWTALSRPPTSALKQISGGRLKGKTDINPQWRYQAMTEKFGPIGFGWKYTIDRLWTEDGPNGERMAFAQVSLYVNHDGAWSDAIQGIGGASMIAMEKSGLVGSDEAYKMATTDALSVSLKMLGVAAEIYLGNWDGSKYKTAPPAEADDDKGSDILPPPIAWAIRSCKTVAALEAQIEKWRKDGLSGKPDFIAAMKKAIDGRRAELEAKAAKDEFVAEMEAHA